MDFDPQYTPLVVGGIIIAAVMVILSIVKKCLYICNPNEILIFSGRKRVMEDGSSTGYRVIFGGRAFRVPIIETVDKMDMTEMPVLVEVNNAYSKGGIALHVHAIANVKVSNDPRVVGNAIERFLGRDPREIARVARETLEGNVRGVVATMTPEQVNEDRLEFAERTTKDVTHDLAKLGIQIDTLKIQSVSDDVDYLSSIGRKRIADIIKQAEIAESDALREAETVEANQDQIAVVAQTDVRTAIHQKENALRKIKADLDGECRSEEERTEAAALEARALAEQELQEIRSKIEKLRLQADQVLPAEADREARFLQAQGDAAPLLENASAEAHVNDLLSKVWLEAGDAAAQVFLIQQIEMVLRKVADIPGRVDLNSVHLVDNGDGKTLSALVNAYPDLVLDFLDRVNRTLGIDVVGTLRGSQGQEG
jgi:flotillin